MKFLHTMIRVTDVEKSLKFYQEILGMKLVRTMELTHAKATLYFLTDKEESCQIELTYNHVAPEGGYVAGTSFGHFAFATENMDEFSEKLKQNGLNYSIEPFFIKEAGLKIAFVQDPDGLDIEIIERKNV